VAELKHDKGNKTLGVCYFQLNFLATLYNVIHLTKKRL